MTKKLLVADDSPTIQKVIKLAFAGEDIVVHGVERGDDALEQARDLMPDLVLADVSIPGLDGYQLCGRIKSDSTCGAIPVVLMTGVMEELDEGEAKRVGFDAHLSKPFDTGLLVKTVRELMGLAREDPAGRIELVSARTRESFLGSGSILDVFGSTLNQSQRPQPVLAVTPQPEAHVGSTPVAAAATVPKQEIAHEAPPAAPQATRQVIPFPGPKGGDIQSSAVELPDEIVDAIAQRVIRQMSPDVIREVAWEVIPDLAEIIIRQYLDEHGVGKS